MKRFLPLLAVLALICACHEEDQPGGDGPDNGGGGNNNQQGVELTLSANKMAFSSYKGEQVVEVTTNQQSWTADVAQDSREWLSIAMEDKTIKVSVSENAEAAERQGVVSVKAGGNTVTLTVTQDGLGEDAANGQGTTVEYTLAEGTTIAPKSLSQYITSINTEEQTFYISKDIPEELVPTKGKLIINTPTKVLPQGLVANVLSITETADGYKAIYNPMGLTDVFQSLNVNVEDLDIGEYVTGIEDENGNPVEFSVTKAFASHSFHIDIPQFQWEIFSGFSVTPQMGADILLKLQLIVDDYTVSSLNVKADAKLQWGADFELAADVSKNWRKKIMSFYMAAIPVGPLLLTPSIDVFAIASVGGKMSLTAQVRTTVSSTAWLQYDCKHGTSSYSDTTDPEVGPTTCEIGTSAEVNASAGISIGVGVGIFTEIFKAGISIDAVVTLALSSSLDLDSWRTFDPEVWIGNAIPETQVSASLNVFGSLYYSYPGLGEGIGNYDSIQISPGYVCELAKWNVFPKLSQDLECVQEGGDVFTVRTYVEAPSLFSGVSGSKFGELVLTYKDSNSALAERKIVPFNMTEDKAAALRNNPDIPQLIEAKVDGLEPNRFYDFTVCWKIGTGLIPLNRVSVRTMRSQDYNALLSILGAIQSCASGNWEECNWGEDGLLVGQYKNVSLALVSEMESGDFTFSITIPKEWQFGRNLTIGNYSPANNFKWDLILEGERSFETVDIQDKTCSLNLLQKLETKNFIFRGMYVYDGYPSLFLRVTDKFDASNSEFNDEVYIDDTICPSEIILDNCPNYTSLGITIPKGKELKTYSVKNTGMDTHGKDFRLEVHGKITDDVINGLSDIKRPNKYLYIRDDSDMTSLSLGPGPTYVYLYSPKVRSVSATGASDLRSLYLEWGHKATSLTVSDCPKLEDLVVSTNYENTGSLSVFSISGVPAINRLSIGGQKGLGGVVPSVLAQMEKDGKNVSYDVRYTYYYQDRYAAGQSYDDWETTNIKPDQGWVYVKSLKRWDEEWNGWLTDYKIWYYNHGYGYYYSEEPSRGYHFDKSELPGSYGGH